jgi:hypothetical protein
MCRDIETERWFNFNDTTITEIEGGIFKPHEAPTQAPTVPHNAVSMEKGAYMLFYRRKGLPLVTVAPSDIPTALREWVGADNEKYVALKAEWKYERSFLHMKVGHFVHVC